MLRSREVVTHAIQQTATVQEAVADFLDNKISSLVVYDRERLAGIFTKNDLVRCCHRHLGDVSTLKVAEAMKTDLYVTQPDADVDEVIAVMVEREFRHVPVVENGRVIGMLSSQDILTHKNDLLQVEREELMRYIQGSY
jgi:CBS domain-containing protein